MQEEKENSQNNHVIKMSQHISQTKSMKKRKQLSISERRELRVNYRNLHDETEGIKSQNVNDQILIIFLILSLDRRAEIMSGSASLLVLQIKKGNELFKKGFEDFLILVIIYTILCYS